MIQREEVMFDSEQSLRTMLSPSALCPSCKDHYHSSQAIFDFLGFNSQQGHNKAEQIDITQIILMSDFYSLK